MPEPPIPERGLGAGDLADKHSAPLSGALLARKGAASADGFTLAEAALTRTRLQSSYRWRLAFISATLAISVGVIAFVGATLMFGGGSEPPIAPRRIVEVPAASSPAAIESAASPVLPLLVAAPSAVTPKPLAVAVANDLSKQHADKIVTGATVPRTAEEKPVAEPVAGDDAGQSETLLANTSESTRPAASPPPRPKKRPPHIARTAYRVQLHALASDAAVRREWRRLRKRHRALFAGLKLTVSPTRNNASDKTVFRMRLGALSSRTHARALCKKLRRRKMSCMVVR